MRRIHSNQDVGVFPLTPCARGLDEGTCRKQRAKSKEQRAKGQKILLPNLLQNFFGEVVAHLGVVLQHFEVRILQQLLLLVVQ